MCWSAGWRACALVLVVTLFSASLGPVRPRSGCTQCAPDCPMHAKKLGCHDGPGPGCHSSGGGKVRRGACGRSAPAMPAGTLQATLVPRFVTAPVLVRHRLPVAFVVPVAAPALAPPGEPPEASSV